MNWDRPKKAHEQVKQGINANAMGVSREDVNKRKPLKVFPQRFPMLKIR